MKSKRLGLLLYIYITAIFCFTANAQNGDGLKWFVSAEQYRSKAQYLEALDAYNKAVEKEPKQHRYLFGKAQCEFQLKKQEQALATLNEVIKLNQKYAPAYELMARIFMMKGDEDKASKMLEMAFKHESKKHKRFSYISYVIKQNMKQKDYLSAKSHIKEAQIINPSKESLYHLEAKVNNELGKYEEAKKSILKIKPIIKSWGLGKRAKYYYELGYAHYKLEEYEEAEKAWSRAEHGNYKIKIRLLSPSHFVQVARAYEQIYEYGESEKYISQILKIAPHRPDGYLLSADIFIGRSPHGDVLDFYDKAIIYEKNPVKKAELYQKSAEIHLQLNNYSKAMEHINKGLEIKPKDAEMLFFKGLVFYKMESFTNAIDVLDKAEHSTRQINSKSKIYFLMGMAFKKSNNKSKAKETFSYVVSKPYKDAAFQEILVINGIDTESFSDDGANDTFENSN